MSCQLGHQQCPPSILPGVPSKKLCRAHDCCGLACACCHALLPSASGQWQLLDCPSVGATHGQLTEEAAACRCQPGMPVVKEAFAPADLLQAALQPCHLSHAEYPPQPAMLSQPCPAVIPRCAVLAGKAASVTCDKPDVVPLATMPWCSITMRAHPTAWRVLHIPGEVCTALPCVLHQRMVITAAVQAAQQYL